MSARGRCERGAGPTDVDLAKESGAFHGAVRATGRAHTQHARGMHVPMPSSVRPEERREFGDDTIPHPSDQGLQRLRHHEVPVGTCDLDRDGSSAADLYCYLAFTRNTVPEAELGDVSAVRTETRSLLLDDLPTYCHHAPGVHDAMAKNDQLAVLVGILQAADEAERFQHGILALVRLSLRYHRDSFSRDALDLGSETPTPFLIVDECPGRVCLPRVGCLDREGGACFPVPRSHRDRKVVECRAQIIKAFTDDDGNHRVGPLGHLQAVKPDVPQAFGLPDPYGPVRVPARISGHRLLDLVEVLLRPFGLEIP